MGVLSKTASEIEEALGKADNIEATFDTLLTQKMLSIYPVGAIYMSILSTSPASLFGGTWEQIENRFLLAAGDIYAAGATGGEATHTLTVKEMPKHTHRVKYTGGSANGVYGGQPGTSVAANFAYNSLIIDYEGGDAAHNNMPPYLVVYMWKRTA